MKLSLQFPMVTKSENLLRSLPFAVARVAKTKGVEAANGLAIAIAQRTAKQRADVRKILDSQLPRLKRLVDVSGRPAYYPPTERDPARLTDNFYRVTIIRISAGELDTDGLHGALKAVRDEIAAWLGIDDSARSPGSWRVGQQRCPRGVHAVRIEIEDDDPDAREVIKIVGGPIVKLGPVVGDVQHGERGWANHPTYRAAPATCGSCGGPCEPDVHIEAECAELRRIRGAPARRRCPPSASLCTAEQAPLVFRRSYYAPPGQDEEADDVTLEELTGPLFEVLEPPAKIIKGGRMYARRLDSHPALGEHWIYEAAPSAARPSPQRERPEARR